MKKKTRTIQLQIQCELKDKNREQQQRWDKWCCGNHCRTDTGFFVFISLGSIFALISSLLGTEEISKGFKKKSSAAILTYYQLGFSIASGFFYVFGLFNNMCRRIPDEEEISDLINQESNILIGHQKVTTAMIEQLRPNEQDQ